jgi:hypothetical protein
MSEGFKMSEEQRGPGNPNWKPGISGNPNGRPRKSECVTSLLRELLENDPVEVIKMWNEGEVTGAMQTAKALFAKMSKGDMTAIREALDRVEGKVPQGMRFGSEQGGPLSFTLEFENAAREKLRTELDRIAERRADTEDLTKPDAEE